MFTGRIIKKDSVIAVLNGENYLIDDSHAQFKRIKEAVLANDTESFLALLKNDVPLAPLADIPNVTVEDGVVKYKGHVLNSDLAKDILDIYEEGYSPDFLVNFLEKLMQNPSKRALDESYKFLKALGLSICEDGDFLAYKCVSNNYLDKHSGKFSNHVGAVLEMERNQVDDNCQQTCSYGFHVGNLSYSGPGGSFHGSGDIVLIVKVNPKDIVSVPVDYSCGKCRVCRYEVIDHYKGPLKNKVYSGEVNNNEVVSNYIEFNDIEVGKRYTAWNDGVEIEILVDHKKDDRIWCDVINELDSYYDVFQIDELEDISELE